MSSTAALVVKIAYVVTISRSLHMWNVGSWSHLATTLFQSELVTNNVINDEVNLARSSSPLLTPHRDDKKMETYQVHIQAAMTFQPELVTNNMVNDEVDLARPSLSLRTCRRVDNSLETDKALMPRNWMVTAMLRTAARADIFLYLTPAPTPKDTSPHAVVKDFGKLAPVPPIIISTASAVFEETTDEGFTALVKQSFAAKNVMVMTMMIMIGARRTSYRQTKFRSGGVRTSVDALLLLMMIAGRCEGALLENNSDYQACLSNPASCTSLNARRSGLTGPLPTQLGTLTALKNLYLNDNQLTGTVPTELGAMTAMQVM